MSNVIRLGDYITEISEKTTVNNQHMVLTSSQEGIVSQDDYFNKQVASKDNTGYKIIRRGQFTYRAMSDTGRFYINRLTDYDIGIVSPAYPVFELRTNGQILPEYLQEYFHSEHFQNAITLSSTGSTRVSLKLAKIADLRIDIPTLPKQQCAVQAISHVNHLISMQNSSAAKLDQLVKSRFVEMFGDLSDFVKITDIAYTYIGLVTTMTKHYCDNGTPLLFNSSIKSEKIIWDGTYLDAAFAEANKSRMHKTNDIITVHTGDIGTSAVIDEKFNNSLGFATIVTRINDTSRYYPRFVSSFLNYGSGKEQIKKYSRDIRNNLNLKDFNRLMVPNVSALAQKRYVDFLEQVDKSKLAVKQSLEKLETLKKSLMQQYFG